MPELQRGTDAPAEPRASERPEPQRESGEESEYLRAARFSVEALDQARRHRSPPKPPAYAVWYTYVAGEDAALKARVDSELIKADQVDLDTIEQIYEEHFLQKRLSRGITRIGDELESGLADAQRAIRDSQGASQAFLASLSQTQRGMASIRRPAEVRRAVDRLLQLGRDQSARTDTINGELAKVRAQVGELQRELRRLRDSAYLDHLTQIPNRRHLDEVLEREVSLAQTNGLPLSFALADLDHFKGLNDRHGHQVGDAMLKHVAALIKDNIKGRDTPARFGGEEFAILFPRTTLFNAARLADNLRRMLFETDFVLSRDHSAIGRVTVSFGVTQLLATDSANDLIARADALLYRAKKNGRNRVESDM